MQSVQFKLWVCVVCVWRACRSELNYGLHSTLLSSRPMPFLLRIWTGMQRHTHTPAHVTIMSRHTNSALTCLLLHWSDYTFSILFFNFSSCTNTRAHFGIFIIPSDLAKQNVFVHEWKIFALWIAQIVRVTSKMPRNFSDSVISHG